MRRALPLLAAALGLACGVDFSAPLADTAADLRVSVSLVDSAPAGEAGVSGILWPGFDPQGRVRAPSDSSLRVLGRTVTPYYGPLTQEPDGIPYFDQWGFNPELPVGVVELAAPPVPGTGAPPVLRLAPPWRSGPSAVSAAAGSPLILPLTVEPLPGDTVHESWRVDLVKDARFVAHLDATGPAPANLEIPWAMLAGLGSGGTVRLTVQQSVGTLAGAGGYSAALFVTSTHTWSVTVEP